LIPQLTNPTKNKPIFDRHKPPPQKLPKVLVVDDDAAGADSLAFMLSHAGYQTAVAYSGKEAIARAAEFKPDMLLSDVRMPEVDGVQTAVAISKLFPQCQCLLFSGHVNSKSLIDDFREKGHKFEFFEKPLHPQELISKLKFALG
jgi:DNA-binding NtrC family response regulator